PDGGEIAIVAIGERFNSLYAAQASFDEAADITALLFGNRGDAGERLAGRIEHHCGIANREYLRMARHREVGIDLDSTGAVALDTDPLARRRCGHAGGPNHRPRIDACRADRYA